MLKNLRKRTSGQSSGFTIIEVLIVLAIAGLILLIVFLAVPALQRNSRNTQRKNDVSAILGGISEFTNNNAGVMPDKITQVSGSEFAVTKGAYVAVTNTGTPVKLGYYSSQTSIPITTATTPPTQGAPISVVTSATCTGNAATGGASARNIAVLYIIEPGATVQCQAS